MSAFGVHDPGGNGVPFSEAWAWVTVHGGMEGDAITAVQIPGHGWMPLVFQLERNARRYEPIVRQLANETGKPQRLLRLTGATLVDEILPGSAP